MKKLICILLTVSLLMSVLMSVMVFSASADIVPTGYAYVDNSEAPSEAPTEVEPEPTSCVPTPEPTEEALLDPTKPYTPAEATEAKPIFELKYEEIWDGTLQICGFENNTGAVDLVLKR